MTLFIFLVFVTVAPYATAQSSLVNQTGDDFLSSQIYEEEIHHTQPEILVVRPIELEVSFPHFIPLKAQTVALDFLKPPLG